MNEPLFSLLIANYNNGNYLQEAIDSVLSQSYKNWEIIIVDDGSTDNSREVYQQYEKDNRFRIFYNDCNHGCGYSKRRCVEEARGGVCGFLDPDDTLMPEALAKMMEVHEEQPDVSIVYSRCYLCDENMNIKGTNKLLSLNEGESFYTYRWFGAMNFSSFKKSFYDQTEGISPYLLAGVDQDLYFKMEEVGKIYVLDEFTYKYRKGVSTAVTNNWFRVWFWNLEVRRNACIRRGLDLKEETFQDFVKVVQERESNLLMQNRHDVLFSSVPFRVGYFLLYPFIKIMGLVNCIKKNK